MVTILITNDDGLDSSGIKALEQSLRQNLKARVITVAPDRDKSAVSHSLTMNRPLRVYNKGGDRYAIDGTPTDCIVIGLHKILTEKPDLIISGINAGPNLGDDISYSGTVAAALEGTMNTIPSMAVSHHDKDSDFLKAADITAKLATLVMDKGLPENTMVNVNFPAHDAINGIEITRQGRRLWHDAIRETTDPWGRTLYWIGGGTPKTTSATDTDVHAVTNGCISITPIHLDKTNHEGFFRLKDDWKFDDILL